MLIAQFIHPQSFIETNIVGNVSVIEASKEYVSRNYFTKEGAFSLLHVFMDEVYEFLEPKEPAEKRPRPNSP